MDTIGTRIRSALTRIDKSPKWLSTEVGVSYETVRKWLADEIAPKRARVADVARALNLAEEELMFGPAERHAERHAVSHESPAQEPVQNWPFSAPRPSFDKLSPEEQTHLDAVVSRYIAGCLAEEQHPAKPKKVIEFTGLHPEKAAGHRKAK